MARIERRIHVFAAAAAAWLLAGAAEPALADMVRLTQSEVIAHVSGKTETWTKGGGYYADDGIMQVV